MSYTLPSHSLSLSLLILSLLYCVNAIPELSSSNKQLQYQWQWRRQSLLFLYINATSTTNNSTIITIVMITFKYNYTENALCKCKTIFFFTLVMENSILFFSCLRKFCNAFQSMYLMLVPYCSQMVSDKRTHFSINP